MRVIWNATYRVSKSGSIIGKEERLTPYETLRCIALWSACPYFEETKKASLEVGKLVDLVILDENALIVELDAIKDILVLETIKEGITGYRKS
jgi:predicted amidohydrolase YtcJ